MAAAAVVSPSVSTHVFASGTSQVGVESGGGNLPEQIADPKPASEVKTSLLSGFQRDPGSRSLVLGQVMFYSEHSLIHCSGCEGRFRWM